MNGRNRRGLTLIELMIVLPLSAYLLSFIIFTLLNTGSLVKRQSERSSCSANARSALGQILSDIRSADHLSPLSSPSVLIIGSGTDAIAYDLAAKKVRRTKNGYSQYFTADGSVAGLTF
ncbi:MAG: prepilin-type N-terminal cleavage/methylation domain-containing protein, partial [Candidatus Omnitrophota bacterium]